MASYDYLDQLIKNAEEISSDSLSDVRRKTYDDMSDDIGLSLYKRPKYLGQELSKVENQYNELKTPKSDLASQLILAFAPAVAGAVGGESAAIAAPAASKQARDIYDVQMKESKQDVTDQKKALMDKYKKLLDIDKNAADQWLKAQKMQSDAATRAENLDFKREQLAQQAEIAKGNQDIRKLLAGAQNERAQEKKEERISKEQKLSDKQLESVNDLDTAKSDLQNILDLKESRKIETGQIAGRVPEFFAGEDVAAFRSALGRYKDQYRKAITGAGAGPTEIAMLEKRLPNETDQPENFIAKAKEAQRELDRRKDIFLSNLQKQGKKTDQFKEEQVQSEIGFTEDKAKRLQELRAKKAAGKLGQ